MRKPDDEKPEVPSKKEYASPEMLAQRRRELFTQQGLSLKASDGTRYEWFIHTGSSKDISPDFKHGGAGHRLFTSVDMAVALTFGIRALDKAKGGDLVGVIIFLEASLLRLLQMERHFTEDAIDIGGREFVFEPGSGVTINEFARWIYLPPEFFLK